MRSGPCRVFAILDHQKDQERSEQPSPQLQLLQVLMRNLQRTTPSRSSTNRQYRDRHAGLRESLATLYSPRKPQRSNNRQNRPSSPRHLPALEQISEVRQRHVLPNSHRRHHSLQIPRGNQLQKRPILHKRPQIKVRHACKVPRVGKTKRQLETPIRQDSSDLFHEAKRASPKEAKQEDAKTDVVRMIFLLSHQQLYPILLSVNI